MRRCVLLLLLALANVAQGKQEVTGVSPPGSLHLEAKPAFPAYVRVLSKRFDEPSGNGALDAEEIGQLVVQVKNEGLGRGRLTLKLTPLSDMEHLSFQRSVDVGEGDVDESRTIEIPIRADVEVETVRRDFRVEIVEEYYKDVTPFTFSFDTRARWGQDRDDSGAVYLSLEGST